MSNVTLCHNIQRQIQIVKLFVMHFIHFPINFRSTNLNILITTTPKFSLQSFLIVTHQVKYTRIYKKKIGTHTHTFVSQKSRFQTARKNMMM